MFQKIKSARAKKLFYYTVLTNSAIGIINLLINYAALQEMSSGGFGWQIPVAFASTFLMAFFSQAANIIALALICYFACAAMNTGFDVKVFIRMSAKALVLSPWLALTDTIGFLTLGQKLVSFGIIGLLSYVPFYIGVACLMYNIAPQYVSLGRKERRILALVTGMSVILLSYPN